jgi:hypothetical protein
VGKIIFWIVVFFLVLLALRLVSVHKTRQDENERREREDKPGTKKGNRDDTPANEAMVKCSRCGVFFPKSTSVMTSTGLACNDSSCRHRPR